MTGAGSLQGPASAQALVNAISSQNVDDSFTTYTFFVSPPTALIDPIGDHVVGDRFTIQGSTNLAVGDKLLVEVTSSSFKPTQKSTAGEFSGASGEVTVVAGPGGYNRWSFDIDAATFKPDEYIVKVNGITVDVTGSSTFNIVERLPATLATPGSVSTPATPAVVVTTAVPTLPATTTQKSPVPVGIVIGACVAVILIKKAGV
jgi:hypothetical protein